MMSWIWRFLKSTPLVFSHFIAVAVMVYFVVVMVCGRHGIPCGGHGLWPSWYRLSLDRKASDIKAIILTGIDGSYRGPLSPSGWHCIRDDVDDSGSLAIADAPPLLGKYRLGSVLQRLILFLDFFSIVACSHMHNNTELQSAYRPF